MTLTIMPDGRILTDDPAEAVRVSKLLRIQNAAARAALQAKSAASSQQPPATQTAAASPKPQPKARSSASATTVLAGGALSPEEAQEYKMLKALWAELSAEQRSILQLLRQKGKMSVDEMMTKMGVDNGNAIGGVFGAMSKRAEKVGLKFIDLVAKVVEGEKVSYVARPMLMRWTALDPEDPWGFEEEEPL
jgi:hypothetical protein